MAETALVEMQIKEGQRLVESLIGDGMSITAASWIKEAESGQWYLYLATPLVGEDRVTLPAYRRVNTVIRQKEDLQLDPFEIKVVAPADSIAVDIAKHMNAARKSTWFRGSRLGDLSVEEAFIYPPLAHVDANGTSGK